MVLANSTPGARPTFRFAPSPNGFLHLGHAYSALLNQSLARAAGGRLLLRLEDIDPERCRANYADAIEEDLGWIGIRWERPARRQSHHLATYAAALWDLERSGFAYPCFCTRGTIRAAIEGRPGWPADPDGMALYPGTCRSLGQAERRRRMSSQRPAFRLNLGAALETLAHPLDWVEGSLDGGRNSRVQADPGRWGDALIARRDVPTSYHVSVVIDDAGQGVTDVVRGADLFAATGLHRLLQSLLGLPAPRYRHHELVLDQAGRKLSKSHRAPSLRSLREAGTTAAEIRRQLGFAEDPIG